MDTAGPTVLAATLAAATVLGLLWRRAQGRFRAPGRSAAPAAGAAAGGDTREEGSTTVADTADGSVVLDAGDLGSALGERATLVQFSSAFCQPCRATRRVLEEVSGMVDGVAHVEIDAEAHLGLVRRLDILRTPTVLVLDSRGAVVRRASGQPRTADVIAAIGAAVP
ncbi:Thiol-disulfide isomerase or thioredoxin [Nocardiopsis flavescens]|uniref:Thiol-disulfide isomerase or thioredoxin n=1 Tax=Nocardiopsis flavescens TaxID=758803 RepID=A0A1M6QUE6_9ACTN|nr:thioredoxin family protein [Nocardiopsis flavescens]SHK23740.1 Thiol-disulfide isomerase or thioredoxin [Nocardiopsis flavescens]